MEQGLNTTENWNAKLWPKYDYRYFAKTGLQESYDIWDLYVEVFCVEFEPDRNCIGKSVTFYREAVTDWRLGWYVR